MAQMHIEKMGVKHSAILDYILLHEGKCTQQEVATHFGMTRVWVSCIMNSDAFKAELAARKSQIEGMVNLTISDRINGIAAMGLERLGTMVEYSNDPDFVLDATDKLLHRAGYAPSKGPSTSVTVNQQNNTYIPVSRDVLAECRQQIVAQAQQPVLPQPEPEDVAFESVRALIPVSAAGEV